MKYLSNLHVHCELVVLVKIFFLQGDLVIVLNLEKDNRSSHNRRPNFVVWNRIKQRKYQGMKSFTLVTRYLASQVKKIAATPNKLSPLLHPPLATPCAFSKFSSLAFNVVPCVLWLLLHKIIFCVSRGKSSQNFKRKPSFKPKRELYEPTVMQGATICVTNIKVIN